MTTATDLPSGWTLAPLSELVEADAPIIYGILQPGPDKPQGVPYVRPTEIVGGRIDVNAVRRTSAQIAERYSRSRLKAGDVLLSIVGTIGKVAFVPPELDGANITQSSVRIRPNERVVTREWIAYSLRSPAAQSFYERQRLGTGVPRLNVAQVRDLVVPVPPLAEQRRISEKLDELLTSSRAVGRALDAVPALLDRLRNAALAKAFRLLASGPTAQLSEIVSDARTGLVRSAQQQSVTGVPYVRMQHYDAAGRWQLDRGLTCVQATEAEARQYALNVGDVLFNTRNSQELVGKVAFWLGAPQLTLYNNNLLRIRFVSTVDPEFAAYQMQAPAFREQLEGFKSATTSVCAIYTRDLMSSRLAVPDLERQRAIAASVREQLASIERIRCELIYLCDLPSAFERAALTKAFLGELVAQDPADEPASTLISRVRAERIAPCPTSRRRLPTRA